MKKIFIVSSFVLLFAAGIFMYYLKNYDNKLVDANVVTTDSNYENITYEKEEKLENDLIGILKIEKIGLKATVKEGSNSKILKDYTREYKINSIKTIFETDLTILENTNENKITMITCIKNKRNQRLCVQAVQI